MALIPTKKDEKAFEAYINKSYESGTTVARTKANAFVQGTLYATTMKNKETGTNASNTLDRLILANNGKDCTLPILAHAITTAIAKDGGRQIKNIGKKIFAHMKYMCGDDSFARSRFNSEQRKQFEEAFTPLRNELEGQYKKYLEVRQYLEYLDNTDKASALSMSNWIAKGSPCI